MACTRTPMWKYLADPWNNANPLEAIYCPFVQDAGAGMGMTVFALVVFGAIGLAMTARIQHPGPILVAGMLSAAFVASTIPGQAATIMFLVFVFGITAVGLYLYRQARSATGL
jgi:hypothetical protein